MCDYFVLSVLHESLKMRPLCRNPGVKTIESEVFEACVKAGAISEDNSDNVNKVWPSSTCDYQRSANCLHRYP